MIDRIIKLNNLEYYVMDEFVKDKKIYLFAVLVDSKNDVVTDNVIICELKQNKDSFIISNVDDNNEEINDIFISRMHAIV